MNDYLKGKRIIIVGPSPSLLKFNKGSFIDSFDVVCRIKKSFPVQKDMESKLGKRTDILISHLKIKGKSSYQNNFTLLDSNEFNRFDWEYYLEKNLDVRSSKYGNKKNAYRHFKKHGQKEGREHKFNNPIRFIYFPFPLIKQFKRFYLTYKEECKNIDLPVEYQKNTDNLDYLKKKLDPYDPTTGIAAIKGILDYNIKELYITGITFQKDGFMSSYKSEKEHKVRTDQVKNIHNMDKEIQVLKELMSLDKRIIIDETLQEILEKYL